MKLGDRGDKTPDLSGEGEVRKPRQLSTPEQIALRVAAFEDEAAASEGVVALNSGYFLVERMRNQKIARVRAAAPKVRG